jgi:hypothetical protein
MVCYRGQFPSCYTLNKGLVVKMNRKLLRKVAKINGVSVKEVRREMELAIDHAYRNPTL